MRAASPDEREEARLHQLLHCGNDQDVAFYVGACERAGPVLELGCGSGRILEALARAGHPVTGLDDHAGMLEAARERLAACDGELRGRVRLVESCMSRFELDERFDRVLIPYNGLLCLLDDSAVRACLGCAREHLAPRGELWLDVYKAPEIARVEALRIAAEGSDDSHHLVTLYEGETRIEVFERDDWDPLAQRVDAFYVFHIHEVNGDVRQVEHVIRQRYLSAAQLESLLAEAGFALLESWGNFRKEAVHGDADHVVLRARPR